jgi:hypothetical protein
MHDKNTVQDAFSEVSRFASGTVLASMNRGVDWCSGMIDFDLWA